MFAHAETAADSIPIYERLVAAGDTALQHEVARGDSLASALAVSEKSTTVLRSLVALQATRITTLEQQLANAPEASRFQIKSLGVRIQPGAFLGLSTAGRRTFGVDIVVTR